MNTHEIMSSGVLMRHGLTPAQRRHFTEQGILHPIPVLAEDEARRYLGHCEALEQALGENVRTVELRQMHLHFRWAYELCMRQEILDAVESLLGRDLLIWTSEIFKKKANDGTTVISWHRDSDYMGLTPCESVTAWVALTPSARGNGGMKVFPGRQRAQEPDPRSLPRLLMDQSGADRFDGCDPVPVELAAGEMSLHDADIVHGSEANRSPEDRVGFAIRYVTPRSKPGNGKPEALLARGEDRHHHFDLKAPPREDDARNVEGLQESARRHFENVVANVRRAQTSPISRRDRP